MIKKIEALNFKKYAKVTYDDLRLINLFVGKNGAGKTTLLESIFINLGRLNGDIYIRMLQWRGTEEIELSSDSLFKPYFNSYDINKTIQVKLHDEWGVRDLKIKYNPDGVMPSFVQNVPFNTNVISSKVNEGNNLQGDMLEYDYSYKSMSFKHKLIYSQNQFVFNNGNNDNEKLIVGFISTSINTVNRETAQFFAEMKVKKLEKEVIEDLKIVEPRVVDIATKGNKVFLDIGLSEYLPIEHFGDGISRLIFLLVSISARKNGLLLIDEVERGFHYSIQTEVWRALIKWAKKYNCQLITTTHSYEIIQGLVECIDSSNENDIAFFNINGSENGIRYNAKELKTAIISNWEVR